MKTILTIIFVLLIGMAVQAQNGTAEVKVEADAMGIVTCKKEVPLKSENTVARLYMFKNAKVTKALSFTTKLNKAKLV